MFVNNRFVFGTDPSEERDCKEMVKSDSPLFFDVSQKHDLILVVKATLPEKRFIFVLALLFGRVTYCMGAFIGTFLLPRS